VVVTDAADVAQGAGGAQALQLVVQRQAVAGLDLDRGHALGDQGVQAGQGGGDQLGREAARVARMVETMPPPARAISS
jgi:hypothetical protein